MRTHFSIRRPLLAIAVAIAAIAPAFVLSPNALAAPEPEAVPSRWEFSIEPGNLRAISLDVPGQGVRSFYYWTYKVTNNTGSDRPLNPAFELTVEDGTTARTYRSGRNVPREATEMILRKINNPYLLDEVEVQNGLLLQGRENAREGLVVWPLEAFRADEVVIYVEGFSGESRSVTRPDTGERVVLRKTLMLRHQVDGTIETASPRPITRSVERWILR